MPTTPYTSVSAILTLQCATCGFYQKTTNPAIASLLAAKHQAGWGSAHAVTTTGASFLDFTTGTLPPGVTFTRASTGTYNNSSNILATAGVNVARFNYVAGVANLLIEGSATNLLTQSNNFASADWVAGNAGVVTAAQFISPDGTNDGWSLTSGSGNAYVYEIFNFLNVPYTLSVWAKRIVGVAPLQLLMQDQSSGSLTTSTTIARFSFTATPAAAFTANYFQVIAGSGSTNGIFGGQFETGSKMTSYIPTTTAAATRAIDQATFTIPAGVTQLKYTFDDNSTQTVSVSPGSYTIPATLNRANIKTIDTISAGSGSINFDFTSGVLPGAITFTRPSIGTYNSSGNILTTATSNVARFNYVSGVSNLLIEGSATNLLLQSNNFSNAAWTAGSGAVLSAAQFVSPDGSNNGWSLTSGTGNGYLAQVITFSAIPYTTSVWAKSIVGSAPVSLYVFGTTNTPKATSSTLARIVETATPPAGSDNCAILISAASGSTDGFYGAQLETGSKVTSYIPTTTAAVTRAADSATFTIPAGVGALVYTFDDGSTQVVSVSPGSYTIPTTLNRANIKSIVSAPLGFDFTTGSLPGAITFTRPSIGTYNSSGNLLTTASNDVARFNYVSGVSNLLIEGSATNLFTQSNNFSHADWNAAGNGIVATAAQFISPDGTNDGWSVTSNPVNSTFFEFMTVSNIPYTMSIWAKQITASTGTQFAIKGQFSGPLAITTTLARIVYTATPTAGSGSVNYQILTTTGTQGVYGAQLETGSTPTSYIPTTTAAVTRAADSATFTIPAGINTLTYTFDDGSTQVVSVSPGSYTVPTNLNRANIKSIVGSFVPPGVNFDFTTGVLPGAITFTRASIGTYVNNAGTLITAGNNVARFNYIAGVSNLLIEPAATNMVAQSNGFSTSPWVNAGITLAAAQFISPDNSNNGWSVAGNNNPIYQNPPSPFTASTVYTMSLWAKRISGSASPIVVFAVDGVESPWINTSATIARYATAITTGSGGTAAYFRPNNGSTDTIGLYGVQVELGSVSTSYIPTTTAAVTRAADSAVFTVPSGVGHLTYTFDDNSTQSVTVSAGSYTIPTTLNRPNIKSIVGSA